MKKITKLIRRAVPFLLAFAVILSIMPIVTIQPAQAGTNDKFLAAWNKAPTVTADIHAALVGNALNASGLTKADGKAFNTYNRDTLAGEIAALPGIQSKAMNKNSCPTDNITYIVYGSGSFLGFLRNGVIRYGSGYYKELSRASDLTLNFNTAYYLIETTSDATITGVSVSELSDTGYRVTCYFSTTEGIRSVYFPSWSAKDSDHKVWETGELNTTTNSATYYVDISKHNYEFGTYFTHIYAYSTDNADPNAVVCNNTDTTVTVPSLNLSDNFYAFINVVGTPKGGAYAVDCAGKTLSATTDGTTNSTTNVQVQNPDYTDQKQIWHFIKQSDGYYHIRNESYGTPIYLHASGSDVCATAATSLDNDYKWGISINTDVDGKANFNNLTCYYLTTKTVHDSNGGKVLNAHAGDGGGYVNLNTKNKDRNEAFFIYNIYDVRTDIPVTIQSLYDINKTQPDNTRLGATSDGTDVQYITAASSSDFAARREQMWMFERVDEANVQPAKYRIKNVKTGKYLQSDSDKENQNEVYLADWNKTNKGQQWLLLGTSLNETLLVPLSYAQGCKYTYYCNNISAGHWNRTDAIQGLNATNGKTGNESTSLYTYTDDFTDAMRWKIAYARYPVEDLGNFYTSIRASIEELYAISLSKDGNNSDGNEYPTYNNNTVAGIKLRRASDNPAVDQQWYFKYLGDGSYNIQNLATGAYLYNNKETIRAHENCGNDDAAKWYVVREPNGHYSLSNKTDFANPIEIAYAQISGDEQGLRYYPENSTPAQCWVLDVNNQTPPLKGENLGDTFWAYIQSVADPNPYLHCGDTYKPVDGVYDAKMYCKVPQNDAEKKQQENYWKFERHNDGSYTISSCNVQNSVLDRRNGNNGFGSDQDVSIWESNDGYGQRWFIRECGEGEGRYQLESKLDGRVLSLSTADSSVCVLTPDSSDVYKLFNIIPKIDMGIDADLPNVTMRLFNYGRAINSADGAVLPFFNGAKDIMSYVDTDVKTGSNTDIDTMKDTKPTMCSTLVDGYPFVENNNISDSNTTNDFGRSFKNRSGSLKYLFDSNMGDTTNGFVKGKGSATYYNLPGSDYVSNSNYQSQRFNVNDPASLFKKNPKTGLYYYDSLLNAAYFNRDKDSSGNYLTSGNFILYDYTMSVPKAGYPYQSGQNTVTGISVFNGNFFPFNIAHQEGFVSYGDSNSNNRPLIPETNDYVTKGDYVPVNYSLDGNTPLDCWFGVTLESYFEQPKNGMSEGKPVQFNFKGDDDVWVYVDDVLVLDIGGTHQSLSASIDFSTGEVTYPKGTMPNEHTTTTLKALFQAATKRDGTKLYDNNYIAANFTGDTFTSGTKHRLNFFYMERGGVVSYCKINFNLPKGEPIITKKVDGVTEENKDCYYKFRLTGYESNANSSKNASDYTDKEAVDTTDIATDDKGNYKIKNLNFEEVTYTIQDENGVYHNGITPREDGTFYLKHGQTAMFHGLNDGIIYKVIEYPEVYRKVGADSDGYDVPSKNSIYIEYDITVARTEAKYTITDKSNAEETKTVSYDFANNDKNDQKTPVKIRTNLPQHFTFTNTVGDLGITGYAWAVDGEGNRVYLPDVDVGLYQNGNKLKEVKTDSSGFYSFGNTDIPDDLTDNSQLEVRFSADTVTCNGKKYNFSDLSVLSAETEQTWSSLENSQNLCTAVNNDSKLSYATHTITMPSLSQIEGDNGDLSGELLYNAAYNKNKNIYIKYYQNAGFALPPAKSISGLAWNDENKNGIQDETDDKRLSGLNVSLQKQETVRTIKTGKTGDPYISLKDAMFKDTDSNTVKNITITASGLPADDNVSMQIYYATETHPTIENDTQMQKVVSTSAQRHDFVFDFTGKPGWGNGKITKLRLDPVEYRNSSSYIGQKLDISIEFITFNFKDGTKRVFDMRTKQAWETYCEATGTDMEFIDTEEKEYIDFCKKDTTTPVIIKTGRYFDYDTGGVKSYSQGQYKFDNLPEGTYSVKFTGGENELFESFTASEKNQGSDDTLDSDGEPQYDSNGLLQYTLIQPITLSDTNYSSANNDSGFYLTTGSISGLTWNDANKDGIRDKDETELSGITTSLLKKAKVRTYKTAGKDPRMDITSAMYEDIPSADSVKNITVTASGIKEGQTMQIFYVTENSAEQNFHKTQVVDVTSTSDAKHDFVFDFSGCSDWKSGKIKKLRLDPTNANDGEYSVDFITFNFTDGTKKVYDMRTKEACVKYYINAQEVTWSDSNVRTYNTIGADPHLDIKGAMYEDIPSAKSVKNITVTAGEITKGKEMRMYYVTENSTVQHFDEDQSIGVTSTSSNTHDFVFDFSDRADWTSGKILKLRLDPVNDNIGKYSVDFITFNFTDGTKKVYDMQTKEACEKYYEEPSALTWSDAEDNYIYCTKLNSTTPISINTGTAFDYLKGSVTDNKQGAYKYESIVMGTYSVKFTGDDFELFNYLEASPVNASGSTADKDSDGVPQKGDDGLLQYTLIQGITLSAASPDSQHNDSGFYTTIPILPDTGGYGRVVFYIVCASLALGQLLLLLWFLKKKRSKSKPSFTPRYK